MIKINNDDLIPVKDNVRIQVWQQTLDIMRSKGMPTVDNQVWGQITNQIWGRVRNIINNNNLDDNH